MKGSTILIVDDDPDIVEAMEAILSMRNYQTYHAYSGAEVVRIIPQIIPQLILLDYMLPDMLGKEVVKFFKSEDTCKNIPIILVSAASNISSLAREIHVDDYIEKPFDLETLFSVVHRHLS